MHPTNNNTNPGRPHSAKVVPSPNKKKEVMTSEAVKGLLGLTMTISGEKRPVTNQAISRNAQRARDADRRLKENERMGVVKYNTRPLVCNGHCDQKRISEGSDFHKYLVENGILKEKYVTFSDKNTRNGLPTFNYESLLFYSEKALAKTYPGKNVESIEVLENGTQDRPITAFNKYEEIPNNFLANIRTDLIKKLLKKDHFLGILDDENRERRKQGEIIPDEKGESPDHLRC